MSLRVVLSVYFNKTTDRRSAVVSFAVWSRFCAASAASAARFFAFSESWRRTVVTVSTATFSSASTATPSPLPSLSAYPSPKGGPNTQKQEGSKTVCACVCVRACMCVHVCVLPLRGEKPQNRLLSNLNILLTTSHSSLIKTSYTLYHYISCTTFPIWFVAKTDSILPVSGTPRMSSCCVIGPACIAAAKRRRSAELKSPLIRQ